MRRVMVRGIGDVVVEEVPTPRPGPGEVLVRTVLAGICGSDTHAVAGRHPLLPPPYAPGHEVTGVIEGVGRGVDIVSPGQRVVVEPNYSCGSCANCRRGRSNACENLRWLGCDPSGELGGGMGEFFVAPARQLLPISDDITDREAALVECLATPVHAARLAGDLRGATVAILGAGTIGLLTVVATRRAGADRVVVTDLEAVKRDRAARVGADAAVDAGAAGAASAVCDALGGRADVVFDCVSVEVSLAQAIDIVRKAGAILVVGVPQRVTPVRLPEVQDWELRVQGSANYTHEDVVASARIPATGGLPADEIISAVRPLSGAPDAFAEAARHSSGKIEIDPTR